MAGLNIGNINFGILAETKGLKKSYDQLVRWNAEVNKQARKTSKGAETTANAMSKQTEAIKKAFTATVRLMKAQEQVGHTKEQVNATRKAFNRLTKEMTSGRLSTIKYRNSLSAFNRKMDTTKDAIKKVHDEAAGKGKLTKMTVMLRNLESSAVLAVGPLSGIGARIRSVGAISSRTTLQMAGLFAGITAGLVVLGKLAQSAFRAGVAMESVRARFKAATGSAKMARVQFQYVVDTSRELGLNLNVSAKAFSRLTAAAVGTRLAGEGVRKIFHGVAVAAAALRLDQSEVEGTFRAIEQMMSKGTVQAEELRGQLGERLPGAFRLWAMSMKISTKALGKLLKMGEVFAEKDLLKFAEILEDQFKADAASNLNSVTGSLAKLNTEWTLFNDEMNNTVHATGTVTKGIQITSAALEAATEQLKASEEGATSWFRHITDAAQTLGAAMISPSLGISILMDKIHNALEPAKALTDQLDELAEIELGLVDPTEDFSKGFFKAQDDIQKLVDKMDSLQSAMDMQSRGSSATFALAKFAAQAKYAELPVEELAHLAGELGKELGVTLMPNLHGLADGLGIAAERARDLKAEFDLLNNLPKNLEKAREETEKLNERLDHMVSTKMLDDWEAVGEQLLEYRRYLVGIGADEAEIVLMMDRREKALRRIAAAQGVLNDVTDEGERSIKAMWEAEKLLLDAVNAVFTARAKLSKFLVKDNQDLERMRLTLSKMVDQETLDQWEKIGEQVYNYTQKQIAAKVPEQERNRRIAEFTRLAEALYAAQLKLDAIEEARTQGLKDMNKAEAEHMRIVERIVKGTKEASRETRDLARQVAALASGPDSLEVFQKVIKPLEDYTDRLIDAGIKGAQLNQMVAQHNALLQQNMALTGKWAQAGVSAANAVGNALEDVLSMTVSLKDGFRNLLDELWRVLLRLLIIDPIVDNIIANIQKTILQTFKKQQNVLTPIIVTTKKIPPGGTISNPTPAAANNAMFNSTVVQFQAATTQQSQNAVTFQSTVVQFKDATTLLSESAKDISAAADRLQACCCCDDKKKKKGLGTGTSGKNWLDAIYTGVQAYTSYASAGGGGSGGGGSPIGRARGGPVMPGKMYQVHPPEMLYHGNDAYLMNDKRGEVVPLKAAGGGRGGDTFNTVVNLPPQYSPYTADQTAAKTARAVRKVRARNT